MEKGKILELARRCRGLRLAQAKDLVISSGLIYRIISQDGIQFGGTSDSVGYRINFDVIDGVVTESNVG